MTTGDEAVGPDMCSSKAHGVLVVLVLVACCPSHLDQPALTSCVALKGSDPAVSANKFCLSSGVFAAGLMRVYAEGAARQSAQQHMFNTADQPGPSHAHSNIYTRLSNYPSNATSTVLKACQRTRNTSKPPNDRKGSCGSSWPDSSIK